MRNKQSVTDAITKPSIEAFALPSELRRAHNFSSSARPIIGLDLPSTPPPLNRPANTTAAPWRPGDNALPPTVMPETDFLIESRLGDDDPPFSLPASWREAPRPTTRARRPWQWSERSTGAFSGFAGGLLIVVPLVFFLGGNPASSSLPARAAKALDFSYASTSAYFAKLWRENPATPTDSTRKPAPTTALPKLNSLTEAEARTGFTEGRIEAVRSKLRAAASSENAHLWLLLAETYDPNFQRPNASNNEGKGIWQTPAGDIETARFYYHKAMAQGIEAARPRLDALSGR